MLFKGPTLQHPTILTFADWHVDTLAVAAEWVWPAESPGHIVEHRVVWPVETAIVLIRMKPHPPVVPLYLGHLQAREKTHMTSSRTHLTSSDMQRCTVQHRVLAWIKQHMWWLVPFVELWKCPRGCLIVLRSSWTWSSYKRVLTFFMKGYKGYVVHLVQYVSQEDLLLSSGCVTLWRVIKL